MSDPAPRIGVAICAFQSAPVIAACLTSLFASQGVRPRVVVADNASSDDTLQVIRDWASANGDSVSFAEGIAGQVERAEADVTLLRASVNGGFAYGTNEALKPLIAINEIDLFWLVNPDCEALSDTALRFVEASREGPFSLMGGRTVFRDDPETLQSDGGRVSRTTGVCTSVNWGLPISCSTMPSGDSIDFIAGANMVVSRAFIERAGLMVEDYFIYYEEVDWAFRRGDLPIRQVPGSIMLHHGGTVIGTGAVGRLPSPFACYFNSRNRLRFVRRFLGGSLPFAYLYALAKAVHYLTKGAIPQARATVAGMLDRQPPADVRSKLAASSWPLAFGPSVVEESPAIR